MSGASPFIIEACAGNVEHGDSPAETARKEAEQKMGRRVRNLRKVFTFYASPGATTERIHLFVADYASEEHAGEGGGLPEEGEEIETLEVPLERAWAMVRSGEIADAKTVLLLQHLRLVGD